MLRLIRFSIISTAILSFVLFAADGTSAQLRLPRASSKASVMQTIGVTDISVTYHRPGVKGRKIWGDWPADAKAPAGEGTLDNQNARPAGAPIVPYGRLWRTGSNEATQFTVTDDVLVNGQPLAAGTYSLHTIPGKDEWTVVFNDTANQWGSFNYSAANDKLRVKAKPVAAEHQEWLAFEIEPTAENAARVNIRWEKVAVPFTVEIKDVVATTLARARTSVASAKPDDWQTPFQAANYAKANKSADEAAKWYEQSLKAVDELLKTKPTFANLRARSTILMNAGRTQDAIAATEKAIEAGKAEKGDVAPLEKRLADLKAAKQ